VRKLPTGGRKRPAPQRSQARHLLAQAFVSFRQAADSLERSYTQLQAEVARLRTELERANADLQASLEDNARMRAYLWHLLEQMPCGVLVVSDDGLRLANPEARRMLQLEAADGACGALPEVIQELLRQTTADTSEVTLPDTDRVLAITVREADRGAPGERIVLLRDITAEKRLAAESEARRRAQALAEVTALLAHEVRNPLASLELFAGLIADAATGHPDVRGWVEHLQAGLRGLAATVNNVLHFHSQAQPSASPVQLDRLLRETIEFLHPLAQQRQLQISLVHRAGPVTVLGDAHRLQQVVLNLALNAFRAMEPGGTLWLRLDRVEDDGSWVQLEVEDNGCGIAPEHLPQIFEPGFTTRPASAGLGLAVVARVVRQHGGTIAVRSQPGRGTVFTLRLPVENAEGVQDASGAGGG
jgi:two-component system sensor histidine kinase FlrB